MSLPDELHFSNAPVHFLSFELLSSVGVGVRGLHPKKYKWC